MEFYITKLKFEISSLKFQFPTGWNSTLGKWGNNLEKILFQFPTGWNSTDDEIDEDIESAVSIPNGMEFYLRKKVMAAELESV